MRRGLAQTGWALGLILLALLFILFAVALWVWAVYLFVENWMPPSLAAVVTGLASLVAAGVLAWAARRAVS